MTQAPSPSGPTTVGGTGSDPDRPVTGDLVLFDGTCALCHGWVKFVLRRDPAGRFRFAALQSPVGADLLARHGLPSGFLGSVLLVESVGTPGERVHLRSWAALRILSGLGGVWRLARCLEWIPGGWRDAVYDAIAARRHRWFGTADACVLMRQEWRDRFL